jgi:hypothetical protein
MDTEHQPDQSPLMVDINPDLQHRIEVAATERDLSIKEYLEGLLERIVPRNIGAAKQERHPITREAFEGILRLREQIKKDHPGQVFDDSTELIRQMREERSQYLADL